jgi:outer membrane protein assembly factor BamE (lipoprotein component of BamABCDE complex)
MEPHIVFKHDGDEGMTTQKTGGLALLRVAAGAAVMVALGAAAACTPVRETHGYVSDQALPKDVQVGVDTRSTVLARLGSPSTTGNFDQLSWYYVNYVQTKFAFYNAKTPERTVTVIRFTAEDVVSAVDTFGVEKGKIVAYSENVTPTRGRELSLLEQILGNVGRLPLPQGDAEDPRDRRN